MKKAMAFLAITAILTISVPFAAFSQQQEESAKIQVALLLDTSNSMDGLITQAKSQLWKVVNELATAKHQGQMPVLEIALYHYGNDRLNVKGGYIEKISDFTTDLDLVSERLFALTTNGGEEYCGWVIKDATEDLKWSKSPNDLKMIFIAGNEPFNQGKVSFTNSCKETIKKGIIINTIFCGDFNEGVNTDWKKGADLADGSYMSINQNEMTAYVPSPFDDEILKLNTNLNETYIYYGAAGSSAKARQETQDANAAAVSEEVALQRVKSKSGAMYKNSTWDLVDGFKTDKEALKNMKDEDLPDTLKKMTKEEREKYVEAKSKERDEIQIKIKDLNNKRDKYVAEERKKLAITNKNSLDEAMINSLKTKATEKNFEFGK